MIVLLQLIREFGAESIESWCQLIEQDVNELYEFEYILNDNGVELSDRQLESLLKVCNNGTYKSAISIERLRIDKERNIAGWFGA